MSDDNTPAPRDTMLGKVHAQLAADIATRLESRATIAAKYGLTSAQLETLERSPLLQSLIREAELDWSGAANTPERIKLKASMALETIIPEVLGIAADTKNGLGARLDAVRLLHDLTGLKKQQDAQTASPERFTLVLNIGDTPQTIDISPNVAVPAK